LILKSGESGRKDLQQLLQKASFEFTHAGSGEEKEWNLKMVYIRFNKQMIEVIQPIDFMDLKCIHE